MHAQFLKFTIGKETIDDLFKEILVDVLEYHPVNANRWLTHFKSTKTADLRPLPDKYMYKKRIAAIYSPAELFVGQHSIWYHISQNENLMTISIDDNNFINNLPNLLSEIHEYPSDEQIEAISNCVNLVIKEIALDTEKVIEKYRPAYKENSLRQQALKSK